VRFAMPAEMIGMKRRVNSIERARIVDFISLVSLWVISYIVEFLFWDVGGEEDWDLRIQKGDDIGTN
jgi:hypothetical protein